MQKLPLQFKSNSYSNMRGAEAKFKFMKGPGDQVQNEEQRLCYNFITVDWRRLHRHIRRRCHINNIIQQLQLQQQRAPSDR